MAAIFRLGHFIFCPLLRTLPAFSTILPFYLVVDSSFFHAQQPAFKHQKPCLKVLFSLIRHPFSTPIEHFWLCIQCILIHIDSRFDAKCTAFWCKMRCVLMLIALRFDANCTAFWCKIHCILVLIAVHLATNRSFWASNGTTICIFCTFMQNKMAVSVFIPHPPFAPNKPPRESIFSGRRAVGGKKTHL